MRDYRDAKAMATTLRQLLRDRQVDLSHGECLEIVARQFGLRNWNVLADRLGPGRPVVSSGLSLPAGWWPSGARPDLYEMGVDPGMRVGGQVAAVIRARHPEQPLAYAAGVFATLMQSVDAGGWRCRRVALEAGLRCQDVAGAAAIWLRVDKAPGQPIAFDNLETRAAEGPLRGDHDWTTRRIVLDVGEEATTLNYGFMLRGTGSVWATDVRITEVGPDVAQTGTGPRRLDAPGNLDFSRLAGSTETTAGDPGSP